MKVLDRYFLKEIIPSFLLALSFIIFLLFMNQVFYLAEIFISKNVPFLIVLKVLFYLLPSIIALAFPLAFMAGVLGGLARLSSDREIDALKVLGFTPGKILKPLFVLGLVFWLITTGFTFWLTPAANYRWLQTMVNSVLTRISLAVEPGLFIESLPGKVIFIQGKERDETWRNVFVYQLKEDDKFQITLSRTGQLSLAPEKKEAWLYLEDGQNYGFDLKLPEVVLVNSFQKLVQAVDLSRITRNSSLEKKGREKNIKELLEDRIRGKQEASTKPELFRLTEVELHKRLSLPATCLIFVFLGAGLGWRKWRGGRLTGYALSVVILLVYYGLLVVGEEAAMKGKLSPALAMWCPNLLILISGLFFYFTSYRVESGRVQKIYYQIKEIKTRWLRRSYKAVAVSEDEIRKNGRWLVILDRYLIFGFLKLAMFVFLALVFVLSFITFFQNLEMVRENQKPVKLLLTCLWYKLPEFSLLAVLVSLLISCSLLLSYLYRKNEIAAMITAGYSYYRIIMPLLLVALVMVIPGYILQDRVIPRSNAQAEEIWSFISDRPIRTFSYFSHYWLRSKDGRSFYHYDFINPKSKTIGNFLIIELEEKHFQLQEITFAKQAKIEKDSLQLISGWSRKFTQEASSHIRFESRELALKGAEEYFMREWKEPATMSSSELKLYSQDLASMGASANRFLLEAEFRRAFSCAFFILVLISLLAVNLAGDKGFLWPLTISLVGGFVYWQTMAVFRSLGLSEIISPFLAAWSPQILFLLLGGYFLSKVKT